MRKLLIIACCFLALKPVCSQLVIVNSSSDFYTINQGGGLCNTINTGAYCNPNDASQFIFSSALHKDTLYFISRNGILYRMKLGNVASCTALTSFVLNSPFGASVNSLTAGKDGMIYAADGITRELFRYNPYTNVKTLLGTINASPAGDLIFYKDKLMMAAQDGAIYHVNLANPSASTVYIPSSSSLFYGLLAVPFDCGRNKYYGMEWVIDSTNLYEIDMENRVILGVACKLPFLGYDAASNVEDGNTLGVTIDSVVVQPACGANIKADIRVLAYSAEPGPLTYILDGSTTNSTGVFNGISEGPHSIRVSNATNCSKDSSFTVAHGLSPIITLNVNKPVNCNTPNGSISVSASSGFPPITYSIDGGAVGSNALFTNLAGGIHTISIRDAKGCRRDTVIALGYQTLPSFLSSINVVPTFCLSKEGSIIINISPGTNPDDMAASLNSGAQQTSLLFTQLDAGQYLLSVVFQQTCRYDTLITIDRLVNPQPSFRAVTTDQKCLVDNGATHLTISGPDGPYAVSFNNGTISSTYDYYNLAPGIYPITITDNDGCKTDTSIEVKPYSNSPVNIVADKTDPTCEKENGGMIMITATGAQAPYRIRYKNTLYTNGTKLTGLEKGRYMLLIENADGCVADTSFVSLDLQLTPQCNVLFVPTAFTPDNNGLNDTFKPTVGAGVRNYQLLVFNRMGQIVFETTDRYKGWDGKVNGQLQSSAVYAWQVTYNTFDSPQKLISKGTMVLIR